MLWPFIFLSSTLKNNFWLTSSQPICKRFKCLLLIEWKNKQVRWANACQLIHGKCVKNFFFKVLLKNKWPNDWFSIVYLYWFSSELAWEFLNDIRLLFFSIKDSPSVNWWICWIIRRSSECQMKLHLDILPYVLC